MDYATKNEIKEYIFENHSIGDNFCYLDLKIGDRYYHVEGYVYRENGAEFDYQSGYYNKGKMDVVFSKIEDVTDN